MKLLAENIPLTNTFTDIGLIIGPKTLNAANTGDDVIKFSFLKVSVELQINDSKGFEIQALDIDEEDLKEFDLPIETVKKDIVEVEPLIQRLKKNVNSNQSFGWELDTTVDALQIRVRVDIEGVTPAKILSLRYNLGYRQ